MNTFELMIDPTTFGTVASHLNNPRSPIACVLHVRERSMLAPLAEQLVPHIERRTVTLASLPNLLAGPLQDGNLRLSSLYPIEVATPDHMVAVSAIPRLARCDVIYLPPFYLVHTPGLFEGKLVVPEPELRQEMVRRIRV